MGEDIYPECGRVNNFSTIYCEMAMEAFFHASNLADEIKSKDYYITENAKAWDALSKEVIRTVVFSAMTLEAFLNDYAAACLGDAEFYGSFDQLTPISKFELIAKFILKADIDKSKAYYYLLKKLINRRNLYVHNKSKEATFGYTSLEENTEYYEYLEQSICDLEPPKINKQELKEELTEALDALKAVRDIARFFDLHDTNIYAIRKLFRMHSEFLMNSVERYRLFVIKALQIKVEE